MLRPGDGVPIPAALRYVAGAAVLAAPLLLPSLVPLHALGPFVAWILTSGRWLVLAALALSVLTLARSFGGAWAGPAWGAALRGRLDSLPARTFARGLFLMGLVAVVALLPGHRWAGDGLGGDEPKYLRITESLYQDLDADVGSIDLAPLTSGRILRNLGWLARGTWAAVADLGRAEPVPPGHVWRAGHLTVAGRHGGLYYLQSPGLPALLLPAFALQRAVWPDASGPRLALLTVAILWALGLVQATLLATEVSGSRGEGLLAGVLVAFSAPVFLNGWHLYPEAATLPLVPWLLRFARPGGPSLGAGRLAFLGLGVGVLPWLHVKFTLLALVLLALLAARARPLRAPGLAALATPVLFLGALLALYHHRVTGLLTPDALYRRYGPEIYAGPGGFFSGDALRGALIAPFGAWDGLFIMAPALTAGALSAAWVFRRRRTDALPLAAVFASLWAAAAVHGGGAPGPPGRLMAPVACLLGAALAVGLVSLRGWLPFRGSLLILALAGLAITGTMRADWRRAVNPYRGMFPSAETDFSRLLPGGIPGLSPGRRQPDIQRGLVLLAVVGFWAWRCGRPSRVLPPSDVGASAVAARRWQALRDTHLAWWATLAAVSVILVALGP